ncbi:hypothetical protein [Streptomyces sp. NPDC090057]|uniref:hypothetical protein n=1 Tax=Streptomyces sp. NPDC090057 TaxID=3365935 RepID=UPI00381303AC
MSDLNKGRDLWAQMNNRDQDDDEQQDAAVTSVERGRRLYEQRKDRGAFGPPEPAPTDVTPGGDAA